MLTVEDFVLPQGKDAALLPGASYSVPGLFLFSELVYAAVEQVKAKFGYEIPVKYLYGSPQVLWNCGRLIFENHRYSREEIERELTGAAEHGMTPLLTFSNHRLTEEDLTDPDCNFILSVLDRVRGGVIVASELLQGYIERNYPHIELHGSVILTAFTEKRDCAYYEGLSGRYERYVIHPDDNYDFDLLETLPKGRAEIILNERCGYQCAQRREHYESIAQQQPALLAGHLDGPNFIERCPFVPEVKQRYTTTRTVSLTTDHAARLYGMGYDLFKLQGRLDNPYSLFFDFFRYTLEPTVAFPTIYPIFAYTIRRFVKVRDKKRAENRKEG